MAFTRNAGKQRSKQDKQGGSKKNDAPPSWQDYTWNSTVDTLEKSWADYQASRLKNLERIRGVKRAKGPGFVGGDYNTALEQMQRDRRDALRGITQDYGARGMAFSGGLASDVNKYKLDWKKQKEGLEQARNRSIEDIWNASKQQKDIYLQQRKNARLDAIRRRTIESALRP